ncbi:hypothetical protein BGZ61DRAFT_465393 [Ilyonectria robusta]|uniref:uncharacterized protein n=1 Tax=Ilyonectria robusta TaxID=1079257 RepID=UPI001E8CDD08|nr:uncharacterized protein BGZ61DRAFT_465393 [Ilyonectria robusta]KAH8659467.1 hypothetical protein BGZ61DRAFT_465393 [Ilyonectria robusta]
MPISLRNGETEAASRLRMTSQAVAYASEVCAVYFQGNRPLHIPRELLHQNAELTSRDMAIGCYSSSFRELHLDDIAYDTGHILIHSLNTGSYQCLKPQGDTTAKRYTPEFATALRGLGNKLSLLSLISWKSHGCL